MRQKIQVINQVLEVLKAKQSEIFFLLRSLEDTAMRNHAESDGTFNLSKGGREEVGERDAPAAKNLQ